MTEAARILETRNVSFAYGRALAVEDVSFAMDAGECVCLVGRNGSGKSTLMKGILGLVAPVAGSVVLHVARREASFMPQYRHGEEDFPASVREVVLSGCQGLRGFSPSYSREDRDAAAGAMEAMGVTDLARRRVGELSGGQRQRVLLARALCRDPKLLLLDEPYSGLDPEAAAQLTRLLETLRTERNLAVLMSSHDMETVAAHASRILVMDRRAVFDGTVPAWLERFGKGGAA